MHWAWWAEATEPPVLSAHASVMRAAADELRGPWWWRARCWLADVVNGLGCRLEPQDRSSISWVERHGAREFVAIRQVRRPRP